MAMQEFIEDKEEEKKEFKQPRCLQNLRWYFMEYCNNTSIHGFKYLGERRSSVEKIWWIVVLTVSLYICIWLILKTYHKWERAPVIVSFATSETPIWEIPFPAVTICPQTKAIKTDFNFTEAALLKNNDTYMNEQKTKKFEYMSSVCSSKLNLFKDMTPSYTIDNGIISFLMEVQPDFDETIRDCYWCEQRCEKSIYHLFKPIITSDGVCYTFNMLDRDEIFTSDMAKDYYELFNVSHHPRGQWSVEKGYHKNANLSAFPTRTLVSGTNGGLELLLVTLESDLDYICGDALQGYKVILHHPAQMPNPKQDYFRVGLNQDVTASVRPNMMKTSDELKKYRSEERNCFLTTERKLRFFKIYNQRDCLLECLTNYTFNECRCVGFYMPRDNVTKICGPAMQWCVNEANTKFLENEVSFKLEHPDYKIKPNISEERYSEQDCNCLPSCDSLDFDAEVSQSKWDWKKGRRIISPRNESELYHLSKLSIYFKEMQFITSQRNELYGATDFLANCGGLLGLFTGFSIISLMEFIYFATLRFACNFRKLGRYQWSGAEALMRHDEDDS